MATRWPLLAAVSSAHASRRPLLLSLLPGVPCRALVAHRWLFCRPQAVEAQHARGCGVSCKPGAVLHDLTVMWNAV